MPVVHFIGRRGGTPVVGRGGAGSEPPVFIADFRHHVIVCSGEAPIFWRGLELPPAMQVAYCPSWRWAVNRRVNNFSAPVAWPADRGYSKAEARRTALWVGLRKVVVPMNTLVTAGAFDMFLALAGAFTLIRVDGARRVAWAGFAARVVPITPLALVALGAHEALAADAVPGMQAFVDVRVISNAASCGARTGTGALAARVAIVLPHATRTKVTILAMFTVYAGRVVRAVLADAASVELPVLVQACATLGHFRVIHTRRGVAKTLALFALGCVASSAHPPGLLVEHWATALAAGSTSVVLTATLQLCSLGRTLLCMS